MPTCNNKIQRLKILVYTMSCILSISERDRVFYCRSFASLLWLYIIVIVCIVIPGCILTLQGLGGCRHQYDWKNTTICSFIVQKYFVIFCSWVNFFSFSFKLFCCWTDCFSLTAARLFCMTCYWTNATISTKW